VACRLETLGQIGAGDHLRLAKCHRGHLLGAERASIDDHGFHRRRR